MIRQYALSLSPPPLFSSSMYDVKLSKSRTNLSVARANAAIPSRARHRQIHPMMTLDGSFPADFALPLTVEAFCGLSVRAVDRVLSAYCLPVSHRHHHHRLPLPDHREADVFLDDEYESDYYDYDYDDEFNDFDSLDRFGTFDAEARPGFRDRMSAEDRLEVDEDEDQEGGERGVKMGILCEFLGAVSLSHTSTQSQTPREGWPCEDLYGHCCGCRNGCW